MHGLVHQRLNVLRCCASLFLQDLEKQMEPSALPKRTSSYFKIAQIMEFLLGLGVLVVELRLHGQRPY